MNAQMQGELLQDRHQQKINKISQFGYIQKAMPMTL